MRLIKIVVFSLFLLVTPIEILAANYTTCFTPGQMCTELIVNKINNAKENIKVQAYSFTSKAIVNALVSARERGIDVFVLLDKSNVSSRYSVMNTLQQYKISLLIDSRPKIAHNKVIIIDNEQVITGSFNFTVAAQTSNAENVIIINDKSVAKEYLANFSKRATVSESLENYCQHYKKCVKQES